MLINELHEHALKNLEFYTTFTSLKCFFFFFSS